MISKECARKIRGILTEDPQVTKEDREWITLGFWAANEPYGGKDEALLDAALSRILYERSKKKARWRMEEPERLFWDRSKRKTHWRMEETVAATIVRIEASMAEHVKRMDVLERELRESREALDKARSEKLCQVK